MTAPKQKAYPGFPSAVMPSLLSGVAFYLGLTRDSWLLRSVSSMALGSTCVRELSAW